MGKNQHSKDRLFVTRTEWKESGGGHREAARGTAYHPLAFDSCGLSLQPYETPVCSPEGVLFDILNLFPYVQKHKKNPVTGAPMSTKDIIRLNMAKNAEGKWHCPVTFKEFNDHTHVVAVKSSGNVYSWDAVEELNIKRKNWTDLLTGENFTRKDIITLQDPSNAEHMALRDISNFKHLKEVREEEVSKLAGMEQAANIRHNASTEVVLQELYARQKREREEEEEKKRKAEEEEAGDEPGSKKRKILVEDLHPGKKITTGAAAASFTATGYSIATDNSCREATEEEIREARWKYQRKLGKKGYVQLQTTLGNLNLEIHCDFTPRTAENFIGLCKKGYYDGTPFHRLIKGFMIQGGDPTGKGTGGESLWGDPFKDEPDSRLVHDRRGIVSMANAGPGTNRSQFFITFKGCRHLDNQHTIFGRVVGGMETLNRMEAAEADKKDKPVTEIKILSAVVFVDPIEEAHKLFDDDMERRIAERKAATEASSAYTALGAQRPPPAKRSAQEEEDSNRVGFYSKPGPSTAEIGRAHV